MDLVLHIGRHKTGTTAIQRYLARVGHPGLCYPEAGRRLIGTKLHAAHHDVPALVKRQDDGAERDRMHLADRIAEEAVGASVVVLSSEYLETLPAGAMPALGRFVRRIGANRTVVLYFAREQMEYLASRFQQEVIQRARTHDFSAFLQQHPEPHLPTLLDRWGELGEVRVRLYDRASLPDGDVVKELLALVELEPGPSPPFGDANPSVSGNLLLVKAALNAAGADPMPRPAEFRRLASSDPRFTGRFRVPRSLCESTRARSAFNEDLRRIVGDLPMRALWEAPPVPDLPNLDTDLVRIAQGLGLDEQWVDGIRSDLAAIRRWFLADEP
ncbi:MAG: hypothetical protein RLZZ272_195 [Actinomycetota bacterium]|jgi:hypothetical protein